MSSPLSHPVRRLSWTACRMGAGRRKTKTMKLIAAHPSPALGFDDFSFRLRGFAAAPLVRADCYGFVVPSADDA